MKSSKIPTILRYILGVFLIIGGFGNLSQSFLSGIFILASGFFVFPFSWRLLHRKKRIPRAFPVIVPILLFFLAAAFVPSASVQSRTTPLTDETALQQLADTPQPTSEPVSTPTAEPTQEVMPILPENTSTPTPTPTETPTETPTPEIIKAVSYDMTVHFLDVGQGLSILVQSDDQTLIYDGGDRSTSSFVVSYLKQQGIKTIDYMISSHYDSDHMAGLIGCLNAFEVEHLISSDYVHDSKLYQSFLNTVSSKGLTMKHPAVGTEYTFGTGSFQILAPASIDPDDSNKNSVAIKLTCGDTSFLFTGDAESSSETAMCNSGIDLSCDVLVPGHHGSATATSWNLLQAAVPSYAVISCGADNSYGHPHEEVMEKLDSMEIDLFRTDKQGTIVATSDGTSITWNTDPCNDYTPGEEHETKQTSKKETTAAVQQPSSEQSTSSSSDSTPSPTDEPMVWIPATGSRYHAVNNCGRTNPAKARQITRSQAETQGYEACNKCY